MHASNTTIIKTKQDIVSSDAPCYGGELRPVQGMVGREFQLDFAEESFGVFGNQRFHGFRNEKGDCAIAV
jgi:hypothetical protein